MSLTAGETWNYQNHKLHGLSLSGIRTAIAMPELSFSFDVAQGYPYLLNLKRFFLSHGHLDHASGVPYIISQKAMNSQEAGKFYMPFSLIEPLDQIMKLWEKIEGHQYSYEFIGVKADDEIVLNDQFFMKVFPTTHRIESFGYTLFENHKKLKPELQGLSREEIIEHKKHGKEVNEITRTPLISFTGDTQIEFLNSRPWIRDSKVLLVEATYLDERKTIEEARKWGHTHLDEIIPELDTINSEKIILIHLSSRYSDHEAKKIISERIPKAHQHRVEIFPGR